MTDLTVSVKGPVYRTDSGELVGGICLNIDDKSFPEAEWRDFVVVVLNWWVEAISDLSDGGVNSLSLMGGPFEIAMIRRGERVQLKLVSRTARGNIVELEEEVEYSSLVKAIRLACDAAASILREGGFRSEADGLIRTAASIDYL